MKTPRNLPQLHVDFQEPDANVLKKAQENLEASQEVMKLCYDQKATLVER
mgnify:CR=1 FL=1